MIADLGSFIEARPDDLWLCCPIQRGYHDSPTAAEQNVFNLQPHKRPYAFHPS